MYVHFRRSNTSKNVTVRVGQEAETITRTAKLTSNVDESSLRNTCHLRDTKLCAL
jgi:hypothetical protein